MRENPSDVLRFDQKKKGKRVELVKDFTLLYIPTLMYRRKQWLPRKFMCESCSKQETMPYPFDMGSFKEREREVSNTPFYYLNAHNIIY